VFIFFTIDDRELTYPCFFAFNFSSNMFGANYPHDGVRALTSAIERKIMLAGDACSKPLNTIRSHNLHVDDIRGAVGEITSYHERD
jgi:hypothetical protein